MSCPPLLAIAAPHRSNQGDHFWRLARPFYRLRERGVTADICDLDGGGAPLISPAGRIVIVQRMSYIASNAFTGTIGVEAGQVRAWVDRFRQQGALAVVAEMDDDTVSPAYLEWLDASGGLGLVKRQRLVTEQQAWRHVVASVDAVTVSTDPLAAVVRQYTDKPVIVVPNAIDVRWFRDRLGPRPEWAQWMTIGWAGGRRPEADLEPMAVAWGRIVRRYPDVRFVVAGWQPDCIYREIDDLDRIIRVPWQDLDDYPAAMVVDIGCCPLADTPFNRCKSPIKSWEYALTGAAVVASPVVYRDCVGLYGHLATTAEEWESALTVLIENPLRWRWSVLSTREHVDRHHSLTDNLDRWTAAYAQIAASVGVRV